MVGLDKDFGWNIYNPKTEYTRQGVFKEEKLKFSNINSQFKICESYPEYLVVPSDLNSSDIEDSSKFRMRGRFPGK